MNAITISDALANSPTWRAASIIERCAFIKVFKDRGVVITHVIFAWNFFDAGWSRK